VTFIHNGGEAVPVLRTLAGHERLALSTALAAIVRVAERLAPTRPRERRGIPACSDPWAVGGEGGRLRPPLIPPIAPEPPHFFPVRDGISTVVEFAGAYTSRAQVPAATSGRRAGVYPT
jgi:hypothetical protein